MSNFFYRNLNDNQILEVIIGDEILHVKYIGKNTIQPYQVAFTPMQANMWRLKIIKDLEAYKEQVNDGIGYHDYGYRYVLEEEMDSIKLIELDLPVVVKV